MLTALEGVCCRGQQTLPEVTAAKHLALAEGHVSEVSAGRTASVPPEGIKLPVIQETPLLHQPTEQYTCTSARQRQSSGIGPEKSGLVAAKRKRAKSGSRVVAPCFLNPSNSMHHSGSQRTPWLFWQQDAADSNPVSPMRSEISPQLVFKPSRKGRFFYCLRAGVRKTCAKSPDKNPLLRTTIGQPLTVGRQQITFRQAHLGPAQPPPIAPGSRTCGHFAMNQAENARPAEGWVSLTSCV